MFARTFGCQDGSQDQVVFTKLVRATTKALIAGCYLCFLLQVLISCASTLQFPSTKARVDTLQSHSFCRLALRFNSIAFLALTRAAIEANNSANTLTILQGYLYLFFDAEDRQPRRHRNKERPESALIELFVRTCRAFEYEIRYILI